MPVQLTLILPAEVREEILAALRPSGRREVGGILLAEHVARDTFAVRNITVHRVGTFAAFVRRIEDALTPLRQFFGRANEDYTRFNYIGEWHSHPSFAPVPSLPDDLSMHEIVQDKRVGANFVVLLVVKIADDGKLDASVHTYLPDGSKHPSLLRYEDASQIAARASSEAQAGAREQEM